MTRRREGTAFSQSIFSELERAYPREYAEIVTERAFQDSVVANDNRPFQVATDTAEEKAARSMANTFRDAGHMTRFVDHRDDIDLLQVDKAQFRAISRRSPPHHLAELRLANRVFTAKDLMDVVEQVEGFVKDLGQLEWV